MLKTECIMNTVKLVDALSLIQEFIESDHSSKEILKMIERVIGDPQEFNIVETSDRMEGNTLIVEVFPGHCLANIVTSIRAEDYKMEWLKGVLDFSKECNNLNLKGEIQC